MYFSKKFLILVSVFCGSFCFAQQENNELLIEQLIEELAMKELGENYDYDQIADKTIILPSISDRFK